MDEKAKSQNSKVKITTQVQNSNLKMQNDNVKFKKEIILDFELSF
jgi:hypothetical protein